ncbi:hypothetical protein M514_24000 [Trichuris suis]|uniref:Uncharacterized protein n=1 Tax=Trichuris suis TaxID=68888 RepID=A0A085N306_9BILA|nr:hypothetical protein M513_06489 [Trichuris suis]KFD60425.1 hypothetical protein M514_06489 [Trichuris suis]KFD63852.1 hypothetical protein M514_24000 [Trichuris suis]
MTKGHNRKSQEPNQVESSCGNCLRSGHAVAADSEFRPFLNSSLYGFRPPILSEGPRRIRGAPEEKL